MKILVVSDRRDEYLETDPGIERSRAAEAILSCGELPYDYLEYLVTLLNVPFAYVLGNHDRPMLRESGEISRRPQGGIDVHGRCVALRCRSRALLVAGLEGSLRCSGEKKHEYTQAAMMRAALRLGPRLLVNRIRYGRFLDILVGHAPPEGVHEAEDLCHRGFRAHRWLIRRFHPKLMVHGHVHPTYGVDVRPTVLDRTRVVNVYGSEMLEV